MPGGFVQGFVDLDCYPKKVQQDWNLVAFGNGFLREAGWQLERFMWKVCRTSLQLSNILELGKVYVVLLNI